jgi:exopolysaccharide production protein ExoZ
MAQPQRFFAGIQALRAAAAILVVIEHAGSIDHHYTVLGVSYIIPQFSYGRIGIILFFAISGFVIALQRRKPLRTFVVHRLLRIYPSYWLATVVAAVMLGLAGLPVSVTAESMLLYPSTTYDPTSAIPYWTLIFEMTFYTLAAVAFGFRLSDRALTLIAAAWIVTVNVISHPITPAEYYFPGRWILLSPEVQVFPMGLVCGIHYERLKQLGRWPYIAGAVCAFFAGTFLADESYPKLLAMGIYCCCLVVGLADLELRSKAILRLGDASYGIYLLHFPPMYALSAVHPHAGDVWFFVVGMVCGVGFGLFDHWFYRQTTAIASWQDGSGKQPGQRIDDKPLSGISATTN